MAQFARPDANVTQTSFTGGFAEVDEATASDSDFAYGTNNTAAELEVGLSNVTDPSSSVGHIFRYRVARTNAGSVDGGGNAVTVTARLMQGTTQIAADTGKTTTGTWTQYAYTLSGAEADAITDYTDLRLEFVTSASGGSPANRRGGAVSWAELEVPILSAIASPGPKGADTSLVGLATCGSGCSGVLLTSIPLVGGCAGTAVALGVLLTEITLSGSSPGLAAAVGVLSSIMVVNLAGSSAGSGGCSGALATSIALAGSSPGQAVLLGVLLTVIRLSGSSPGVSLVFGVLPATELLLSGAAVGAASSVGVLATGIALAGFTVGVAGALAVFEVPYLCDALGERSKPRLRYPWYSGLRPQT